MSSQWRHSIVNDMNKLCLTVLALLCCTCSFAQNFDQWAGAGAATRFGTSGLTLSYGQEDLLAPGTDARFSASYFSADPGSTGFAIELSADALAHTYDPKPEGLALVAYGGLGPRFLVRPDIYYYTYYFDGAFTSYQLNIGGVGGLEARLNDFGLLLELDISLPVLGLIGPYFRVFPFEAIPIPKLTLGANYYF